MTTLTIDPDLAAQLKPNLSSDEKLLWTGRPKTGLAFRSSDIFLIPFSLLWTGMIVLMFTKVIVSGGPKFVLLFMIPFLVIGFYITIGRFWFDAKKRSSIIYGMTGNRIIIQSGVFSRSIQSLNIKMLSDLTLNEKPDGSGTILLGPSNRFAFFNGGGWPSRAQQPQLEFIPDVRKVHELILSLQQQK